MPSLPRSAFSLIVLRRGPLFRWGVPASHCGAFSLRSQGSGVLWLQSLWPWGPAGMAPGLQSTSSDAVASGLRCPEARGISLDRGPEPVSPASALYVTRPPGKPSSPLQGSCSAHQPGVSGRRPAGEGPHEGTRGPLLRTVPWEARLSLTSSLRNGMTAKILIRDLHVPQV